MCLIVHGSPSKGPVSKQSRSHIVQQVDKQKYISQWATFWQVKVPINEMSQLDEP